MKSIVYVFMLLLFVSFVVAIPHSQYPAFGAPQDSFSANTNGGVSANDDAVYKTGYYSAGGAWQTFSLTGSAFTGASDWLTGSVSASLSNLPNGDVYVITYSCSRVDNAWDCHGGQWQLFIFEKTGTPPPSTDWIVPSKTTPLRIMFLGNSFTGGGNIPDLVNTLARSHDWPSPHIGKNVISGAILTQHRESSDSLALVDQGNWDIVVLQDYSLRATDSGSRSDSVGFKEDVAWFYDRIKSSSPDARIVLYETWAYQEDNNIFPGTYSDPLTMQSQIRFHYNDAADNYIPSHVSFTPKNHIVVAPVGDAWEVHLQESSPLRLHASDNYHADPNGQYINGLMLYASIYHCNVNGVTNWDIPSSDALRLQSAVNSLISYPACG